MYKNIEKQTALELREQVNRVSSQPESVISSTAVGARVSSSAT